MKTNIIVSTNGIVDALRPVPLSGMFPKMIKSDPIDIRAPLQKVWDVLVDLPRYPEWCQFTTRLEGQLDVGSPLTLYLKWGPYNGNQTLGCHDLVQTNEIVTVFEPLRALGWGLSYTYTMQAERVQYLERISPEITRYHTFDRISGLMCPLFVKTYGERIRDGFGEMGRALKARVESM